MRNIGEIWRKNALWIMFLLTIFAIGGANLPNLYNTAKAQFISRSLDTSVAEGTYEDNFWRHEDFIDLQGGVAKTAGQMIDNGVIKGLDGSLYLMDDVEYVFNEKAEQKNCDDTAAIMRAAQDAEADVLYVQRVYKTGELPYGLDFQQNRQYDFWGKAMGTEGFPVLDIRKELEDNLEFYKTDHHWTVESAFLAAQSIVKSLNTNYNLELDEEILQQDKFRELVWENSFLGSMGIRTGKYYVGKDDFTMLEPTFETDLTYKHFINAELEKEKEGDFVEAFVDLAILDDPDYNNKYNACLNGGYVENIIVNHQKPDGLKALIVSDSFARPMVQYLSLCFGETRYLDPQESRYNDSYIQYIREFQPDVVVIMYSGAYVEI